MKYVRDSQTLLVLDPSSSSIGWSIAKLKDGQFLITNAGCLKTSSSWELGERLLYMYRGLKFLIQYFNVNFLVSEEAIVNSRMAGAAVVPTVVNNMKMLIAELPGEIELDLIHVNEWRKILGISGVPKVDKKGQLVLNGKGKPEKDFKKPCAAKVKELLKLELPKTILDNRSLKEKDLPDDVTDCLGIASAYAIKLQYPKIEALKDLFTSEQTIHCIKILYTMK